MRPEDILVENLKAALRAAHQYIIWGTGTALFLLILVFQDWRGTGVAAAIKLPAIGVDAGRSTVELIAAVGCFLLGYMAYLAVYRIKRIKWRLRYWPEIRKAALTFPSIPTINSGAMRIGAVILPAMLFFTALIFIFLPQIKEDTTNAIIVISFALGMSSPYILLAVLLLRYPIGEVTYQVTKLSLDRLKQEDVPAEVLEKLKEMTDIEYPNRPMFLKALVKTMGGLKADKYKREILHHSCDEEAIED